MHHDIFNAIVYLIDVGNGLPNNNTKMKQIIEAAIILTSIFELIKPVQWLL